MLSDISLHHLERLKIVSIMNVAPTGNERDIWMGEQVEGTVYRSNRAGPLGDTVFLVYL